MTGTPIGVNKTPLPRLTDESQDFIDVGLSQEALHQLLGQVSVRTRDYSTRAPVVERLTFS